MRFKFAAAIVAVGLCMIVAAVSMAAVVEPIGRNTTVALRRGSTNVTAAMLTEACDKVSCSLPLPIVVTVANCPGVKSMLIAADGLTRTIGSNVYQCMVADQSIVKFIPAPIVLPPVDCVVSAWGSWSNPPWEACAAGQQSRALVRTRTIVTQPANGGAACPVLVETQTQTQPCLSSVQLRWTPPTQNTDGTALTNLAGYRIHYGLSPDALTQTVQLTNTVLTTQTIEITQPGTWYFALRAYTSEGTESAMSNVLSKAIL